MLKRLEQPPHPRQINILRCQHINVTNIIKPSANLGQILLLIPCDPISGIGKSRDHFIEKHIHS